MEWNVYVYNINSKRIETFNVFEHGSFYNYIKRAVEKYKNKDDFKEELKSELMYYFWSKAEWEILISPWVGGDRKDTIKIDVYEQVMINWNIFSDYVWNNRKEMLND